MTIPQSSRLPSLSGNALKLIAVLAMLTDHIGVLFFPQYPIFRVIGRLAYPIFAFMIAEGCHYTKNRLRYFLSIFLLGVFCQISHLTLSANTHLNILLTFSCSIPLICLLQAWKAGKNPWLLAIFCAAVTFVYVLNEYLTLDYGFWGIMIPVLAAVCHPARGNAYSPDQNSLSVLSLGLGLLLLSMRSGSVQYYSFLALPLLYLYSGRRGNGNYKYAFYLFYPLHLALLLAIAQLIA